MVAFWPLRGGGGDDRWNGVIQGGTLGHRIVGFRVGFGGTRMDDTSSLRNVLTCPLTDEFDARCGKGVGHPGTPAAIMISLESGRSSGCMTSIHRRPGESLDAPGATLQPKRLMRVAHVADGRVTRRMG
jgi:hypothetical protein